ncbi:MAG TPA: ABC transporter ATP-binding protein [Symbiobacteriaceae bacterium]|nr:ABC transporter ATP-binding protein [Symbiobacteriaceae bacterium]
MATLVLRNLAKHYGPTRVVEELNLEIRNREFVTLLGPSGCGKTTTLRMIAGFTEPTAGSILVEGSPVVDVASGAFVPPEKRGMGMVFQSYAVWPHMNVFDNVAYPLKLAKVAKKDIQERVSRILDAVKLGELAGRFPSQLSGGQQQRVALARALVMEPRLLLLDEPLSNLDAKLRETMRFEIKELQRRMQVTIIYVTHDQSEAIAMSDRVVVMHKGRIAQLGSPREIYEQPADSFVADFIGLTNLLPCTVLSQRDAEAVVRLPFAGSPAITCATAVAAAGDATVSIRPENVELSRGEGALTGSVERRTYLGDRVDYLVRVGDTRLRVSTGTDQEFAGGETVALQIKRASLVSG